MYARSHATRQPYGLAAALILGALIGCVALGAASLWYDEAMSVAYATLPLPSLWLVIHHSDAVFGLYYALLHGWTTLFGTSETAVRSLSVVASLGTIWVTYLLGVRLFDRSAATIAAFLVAIDPFFVFFAREARAYSLVIFLAAASTLLFVEAVHRDSRRLWLAYAFVTVLALYMHIFASLIVVAHALALAIRRPPRSTWVAFGLSAGAIVLCALPLLRAMLANEDNQSWIPVPNPHALLAFFIDLAGSLKLLLLEALLIAVGIVVTWRRGDAKGRAWQYALLVTWLVAPVVIVFVISHVRPMFVSRYFALSVVPFVLLIADGIARLRPPVLRVAVLTGIAVLCVLVIKPFYAISAEDWRDAQRYIATRSRPGDAEVRYRPMIAPALDYYAARLPRAAQTPAILYPSPQRYVFWSHYPETNVADRVSALAPGQRLWLVISYPGSEGPESYRGAQAVESGIAEHGFACTHREAMRHVTILLLERTRGRYTDARTPLACNGA